jgi:hypothetical protein
MNGFARILKSGTHEGAVKRWGGSMSHTGVPHGTVLSVREGNGFNSTSKNYLAHSDGNWHELGETSMHKGTLRGVIKPDGNKISDSKMAEIGSTGAAGLIREGGSRNGKIESAFDLEAMPAGTKIALPQVHEYNEPSSTTKQPNGTWLPTHYIEPNIDKPDYMKHKRNTEGKTFTTMQISHWANDPDFKAKIIDN